MTQELELAHDLFQTLNAGRGNANTIRLGKRDIKPGMLWFKSTQTGEKLPVYVTDVVHKKLSELTDEEAQRNGDVSAQSCIKGMIALYTSLGREIDAQSEVTIAEYQPFKALDTNSLDWEQGETRWRGGHEVARWTKPDEPYTKNDGTQNVTNGGEVGILRPGSVTTENPLGEISWALPKHIATSSYNLSALPEDPLDNTPATIQRKPTQVQTVTMTEPVSYPSPFPEDEGAIRYSLPGDMLERAFGKTLVVPVAQSTIESRYIPEELARQQRIGRSAA